MHIYMAVSQLLLCMVWAPNTKTWVLLCCLLCVTVVLLCVIVCLFAFACYGTNLGGGQSPQPTPRRGMGVVGCLQLAV